MFYRLSATQFNFLKISDMLQNIYLVLAKVQRVAGIFPVGKSAGA